jgi:putative ABC transport system permease protein
VSWSRSLYRFLLHCYPRAFRDEYERDMRIAFDQLWRERTAGGTPALVRLSASVVRDTVATALSEHVNILWNDVRIGARSLRKAPAFTLGVVATLMLGIGATTAMFSVVYAILLRPLPLGEPDRLVELVATKPLEGITGFNVSGPDFMSWAERSRTLFDVAALSERGINLADEHEPERVEGMAVSGRFWAAVRVAPLAGRTFDERETEPRPAAVAILSDGLHRRRYGADPNMVGRLIDVNGVPHTVLGVVPSDMGFTQSVDVWVPLSPDRSNRGDRQLEVIARLRPGIGLGEATAELQGIAASLAREFPATNAGYSARARPLLDLAVPASTGRALRMLLAAVALLLLVACANVAHLLLTRAADRRPELAMRRALGAGSVRLTRQVATEAMLLVFAGGLCGVALAFVLVRATQPTLATLLPRARDISLDLPVLATALVATLVTGLLFGLIPVWRLMRSDIADVGGVSSRVRSDRVQIRLRRGFVVGQFAIASILIAGAALLSESLVRMMRVDPGFRTDHLLLVGVTTPGGVSGQDGRVAFFKRLVDHVSDVPGVVSAAVGWNLPLRPGAGGPGMEVSATPEAVLAAGRAHWRIATPEYFPTLGIRLLRGRLFEEAEREVIGGFRAIILSETLAARLWPPSEDPLGRQVWLGNGQVRTVVGVVADVHQTTIADGVTPTMYMPTSWVFPATNTLIVRTAGPPAAMTDAIRSAVRTVDPRQTLFDMQTMEDYVSATMSATRLNATLVGAFAAVALLLGAVGVAGVVAHGVSQRRAELAVRMALGGAPVRIVRELAAGGVRLCVYGLVIGFGGAMALSRVASSLLFDVHPSDPAVVAEVGAVLLAVALLACILPASRAARIDPATALRGD